MNRRKNSASILHITVSSFEKAMVVTSMISEGKEYLGFAVVRSPQTSYSKLQTPMHISTPYHSTKPTEAGDSSHMVLLLHKQWPEARRLKAAMPTSGSCRP